MSRHFTLQEAESLLPKVEGALREAIFLKREFDEAEAALDAVRQRVMSLGGAQVDHKSVLNERARKEGSAAQLKHTLDRIQEYGCQVKDLAMGLIDFPTLYRGEEVLLCWKLGEQGITWWHGLEDGFRGRKKIDQEFLDNHQGDRTN